MSNTCNPSPWALWAALLWGCSGGSSPVDQAPPADQAIQHDLALPDLTLPDLSMPDLRLPPMDLALPPDMVTPTVTGLPTNCTPGVTAQQLYTNVVMNTCAVDQCHGTNSVHWSASSAAALKLIWVDYPADEDHAMNRITPGQVDQSYVMYKLTGQMNKLVADPEVYGHLMPLGASVPLPAATLCYFISWIQGGAQ